MDSTSKVKKVMTLCVPHIHPRVLLGMKKRGFGAGKFNGFGGKLEEGEEIEKAALRELHEEAGIRASAIEKIGVLEHEFRGKPGILEVHIFKVSDFTGDPRESDEMNPRWFFTDEIPFREMWADDRYWFPMFMKGKKFRGRFYYDEKDAIIDYSIEGVEDLQ